MVDFKLEETIIEQAKKDKFDSFYVVSPMVTKAIADCENIIKPGFELKVWSTNKSVSLFNAGDFVVTITYEAIEDGQLQNLLKQYRVF